MNARVVTIEGPSDTVVETALRFIETELHGHFWGWNAARSLRSEQPNMPPTSAELAALLDEHVRPIIERSYLLPADGGDDNDRYVPLDKLTEVYMAIGYVCAATGYPPIDNQRQIAGLRSGLEWALQEIDWEHTD